MNDKNNPIPDPRQSENRDENGAQDVHNRVGSTEHNDYKIKGSDGVNTERDEKESYVDYNGNSEENDPKRR